MRIDIKTSEPVKDGSIRALYLKQESLRAALSKHFAIRCSVGKLGCAMSGRRLKAARTSPPGQKPGKDCWKVLPPYVAWTWQIADGLRQLLKAHESGPNRIQFMSAWRKW